MLYVSRKTLILLAFTVAQADAFGHAAAEAEDGIECLGCTD